MKQLCQKILMRCVLAALVCVGNCADAAQTNVNVFSFGYDPSTVAINVGDKVIWTWTGNSHSVTSTSGAWPDSGVNNSGFTFTNTFSGTGDFPYFCTVHTFMNGSVSVISAVNQPPSVSITNPVGGGTFAAPWTGTIKATASDVDDAVSRVQFFTNSVLAGTISNAPYNLALSNVAAGSYLLKAVATDAGGASGTSAPVSISVVTPIAVSLSDPKLLPPNRFRFTYSANPGLSYVIERGNDLTSLMGIMTNAAASSSVNFTDTTATASQNFYRVGRRPNP